MVEVGRKESFETAVAWLEVVEVSEARGTGLRQYLVWMKVRVRMCWMKMVKVCLGQNVLKMMRGHVVETDAWVADAVALDKASSMGIVGSPFPWTWALDKVSIAAEAAGNE